MKPISKILCGSHLYGTNTENSDTDYKGVFLPSEEEILLQRVPRSLQLGTEKHEGKNTKDDIDYESYSIYHFFKLLFEGQTIAWEMLFAPRENIVQSSAIWEEIIHSKEMFVSKNIKAFVGYCRSQASKYGLKGDRINAIKEVRDILKKLFNEKITSEYCFKTIGDVYNILPENEFAEKFFDEKANHPVYQICGRKFLSTNNIEYVIKCLDEILLSYGKRAEAASSSNGIDWKSVSHAFRVAYEAIELLEDGKITFPLKEAEFIKDVKLGKLNYKEDKIDEKLEQLIDKVEIIYKDSPLPEKANQKVLDEFLLKLLKNYLNF